MSFVIYFSLREKNDESQIFTVQVDAFDVGCRLKIHGQN